ncbi:MAG: hypothetical protein H0W06_06085 [Chloroflexia bacterium]|nr:hypothetical protein [Chloroflexia bacterium]
MAQTVAASMVALDSARIRDLPTGDETHMLLSRRLSDRPTAYTATFVRPVTFRTA